jgi:hypothetical protein
MNLENQEAIETPKSFGRYNSFENKQKGELFFDSMGKCIDNWLSIGDGITRNKIPDSTTWTDHPKGRDDKNYMIYF